MITTLRWGSPGRSVLKVWSNSITGIFSPSSFCRLCCPPKLVALTQKKHHPLYGQCVTSCSVHTCCAALWRFCKLFRGVLAELVKILLVLLGLQGALPVVFLCRLPQGSFQLVVADYSLHVLFTRVLACFRVQDAGCVLVDIADQNFCNVLDCFSV